MPFFRARRALVVLASAGFAAATTSVLSAQDTSARAGHTAQVHRFVQVYYRTGDPVVKDGYRLRKADLKFSGEVSPQFRWRVGFDAAKVLTLAISSAYIETIERTVFIVERSRALGLGDVRDIGASANGKLPMGLQYHIGLFNETGERQGTLDPNEQKALMGRIAYRVPSLSGLRIGGFGGYEPEPFEQRRERARSEIQYKTSAVTLGSETMFALLAFQRLW